MIAHRLMSLAILVMLTFVSLAAPVSAQNSVLTELFSKIKILALMPTKGTDIEIPQPLASLLGLPTGTGWPARQAASKDLRGDYHGFAFNRGSNQDDHDIYVSYFKPTISVHAFRIHPDGTLVAAATHDLKTGRHAILSRDAAQKELEAEFAYWLALLKGDKNFE